MMPGENSPQTTVGFAEDDVYLRKMTPPQGQLLSFGERRPALWPQFSSWPTKCDVIKGPPPTSSDNSHHVLESESRLLKLLKSGLAFVRLLQHREFAGNCAMSRTFTKALTESIRQESQTITVCTNSKQIWFLVTVKYRSFHTSIGKTHKAYETNTHFGPFLPFFRHLPR